MLKKLDKAIVDNPVCSKIIQDFDIKDFQYYDKDGFELNIAEQKYYRQMNHPITPILNHNCWQDPWFEIEDNNFLFLDHCIILHRCRYDGLAAEQLKSICKKIPPAEFLLTTRPKWGYDFALDAVDPHGHIYEVLHVEYDNLNYDEFCLKLEQFENAAIKIDWMDAAHQIYQKRNLWESLKGFDQNNWKANYLLGWSRAEYTEKSLA